MLVVENNSGKPLPRNLSGGMKGKYKGTFFTKLIKREILQSKLQMDFLQRKTQRGIFVKGDSKGFLQRI